MARNINLSMMVILQHFVKQHKNILVIQKIKKNSQMRNLKEIWDKLYLNFRILCVLNVSNNLTKIIVYLQVHAIIIAL